MDAYAKLGTDLSSKWLDSINRLSLVFVWVLLSLCSMVGGFMQKLKDEQGNMGFRKYGCVGRYKNQRGMSALGMIVICVLIGLFALIVIKLVPYYVDDHTIGKLLQEVASSKEAKAGDKLKILDKMDKGFMTNAIYYLSIKDVKVKEDKKEFLVIELNYEVRAPFFHNVEFVLTFKNSQRIYSGVI